jgi:predicted ArsR family transcriptional regulator
MTMHTLPRITGASTDTAERILTLMADNRERTIDDIAVKLKLPRGLVRDCVMALSRHGKSKKLQATNLRDHGEAISIWRAV